MGGKYRKVPLIGEALINKSPPGDSKEIKKQAEALASNKAGVVLAAPFLCGKNGGPLLEYHQRIWYFYQEFAKIARPKPLVIARGMEDFNRMKKDLSPDNRAIDLGVGLFFKAHQLNPEALKTGFFKGNDGRKFVTIYYGQRVRDRLWGFICQSDYIALMGMGRQVEKAKQGISGYLALMGANKEIKIEYGFVFGRE